MMPCRYQAKSPQRTLNLWATHRKVRRCGPIKRREKGGFLLLKQISRRGLRWQSEPLRKKEDKERMADKVERKEGGPGNTVQPPVVCHIWPFSSHIIYFSQKSQGGGKK